MKLIFDYKFRFYKSKMNEICLYCHLLYFFFNHIEFRTICCVIFPDLVDEYQQYQDATADDDEDDEEEEYEQDGDY